MVVSQNMKSMKRKKATKPPSSGVGKLRRQLTLKSRTDWGMGRRDWLDVGTYRV